MCITQKFGCVRFVVHLKIHVNKVKMDIVKTLKEKQILILWIVAFVLLIVLIIITALLPSASKTAKEPTISTSINSTDQLGSTTVRFSDKYVASVNVDKQLPVYKTQNKVLDQYIETFITNNALQLIKSTCDTKYCNWSGDKGFIEVDYSYSYVYFLFKTPVKAYTSIESLSTDNYQEFYTTFVKDNFSLQFDYNTVSFNRENDFFRMKLNRVVDKLPIYTNGYKDFTDYIVADSSGRVVEGQISIFEVLDSSKAMYPSVPSSQLAYLVNLSEYPRTVFWGAEATTIANGSSVSIPNSEGSSGVVGQTINTERPTLCDTDSVSINYYYGNSLKSDLVPIYKIHCSGKVDVDGTEVDIPGIVFLSAIDQQYIID